MSDFTAACPVPLRDYPAVMLAHGGGGTLMNELVEKLFLAALGSGSGERHDSAVLHLPRARAAFTTDSFVVQPLFFPGGNIGELAVFGTVNDLAMSGARPVYLSAGFILEEGLPMETLWRVVQSMARACRRARVEIVAGDTKVVERGSGGGIYINTSGIGVLEHDRLIAPSQVRAGDAVLVSGDLGRHGMAVMAVREGLEFESAIESDAAPLAEMVLALLDGGIGVHCLRDITRGGLASVLNEIASVSGLPIHIGESQVPVRPDVRAACEILGLDPLHVASEGRLAAFVPDEQAGAAVRIMRRFEAGAEACRIGQVAHESGARVMLTSAFGKTRVLDMLSGEQLPRIC